MSVERTEALLDQAELALERGDAEAAARLCGEVLAFEPGHAGAHFVRADALRQLGAFEQAADDYRAAALARPDHASSWASLGITLFELLQLEEANRAADRAIRESPRSPEGWWVRGLIREWFEDEAGAERCFAHACWLDPAGYPRVPRLTEDEIDACIQEALLELSPEIRSFLANVAILLENQPAEETLRSYDPPASPLEIVGHFNGASLMERSSEDPWSMLPPTIVVYRRNLERMANNREELIHQLRITLFHEVGHFLGLDEQDLADRGLE